MKKIIFLMFVLLFPAVSFAQPSIVFTEENHDLGTVNHGEKIEHNFIFKNEGNEELVIERLVPS